MKVITGGRYNGKLEYVKETLGIPSSKILDMEEGDTTLLETGSAEYQVLYHLEAYIKKALSFGADPDPVIKEYVAAHPDCIIVCDELGCGIVPADRFEETYREATGRLMCDLAKKAGGVTRITCGIAEEIAYDI